VNNIEDKIRQLEAEVDSRLSLDLPVNDVEHELAMLKKRAGASQERRSQHEAPLGTVKSR